MEKSIQRVKIYCIALAALALYDLVDFLLSCMGNEFEIVAGELGDEADTVIAIILAFFVIYVAISMLIKLFFSFKGMREIQAKNKGTGYITFAYVIFAFYVIEAALTVTEVIDGEGGWISLIEHVCSAFVMFDYARNCKNIRTLR